MNRSTIISLIQDENADNRRMGFVAAGRDPGVPLKFLIEGLSDTDMDVRRAAAGAFENRDDVDEEMLEKLARGSYYERLAAAYGISANTEISPLLFDFLIRDKSATVQEVAIQAAEGSKIPYDMIYRWSEDRSNAIRAAAVKACLGRDDVPKDLVDRLCFDENAEVRRIAEPLFIKFIDSSKGAFLTAIGYLGSGIYE